jgi:hypothetical protein
MEKNPLPLLLYPINLVLGRGRGEGKERKGKRRVNRVIPVELVSFRVIP